MALRKNKIQELSPKEQRKLNAEQKRINDIQAYSDRKAKKDINDAAARRKTESKHPLHPKRIKNEIKYQGKRVRKLNIGK